MKLICTKHLDCATTKQCASIILSDGIWFWRYGVLRKLIPKEVMFSKQNTYLIHGKDRVCTLIVRVHCFCSFHWAHCLCVLIYSNKYFKAPSMSKPQLEGLPHKRDSSTKRWTLLCVIYTSVHLIFKKVLSIIYKKLL